MNNRPKMLYMVGNSFAFQRSKTGGFISSATGVIDGLCEHGFEVHIVTDSLLPGINNDQNKKYHYYSFRLLRRFIPVKTRINIKNSLTYLDSLLFKYSIKKTLSQLINENTFTFMYLRASHTGHYMAKIAKKYNIPLILEVNKPLSMGPYNQRNGLAWPKQKSDVKVNHNERVQYEIASVITVDSPIRGKWITEFVDEKYADKMVNNPNAVNSTIFKPSKNRIFIRKKYSIGEKKILVGMASSFRWYNDEEELCQIIKATINKNSNILLLLIVGDKRRAKTIKNLIRTNDLDSNTIILEQIPFHEMPNILNMCDILVSHFNFHGVWPHNCSIKHLEYLAVGKPVVATNVGYVNYAVEDNINGILVDEGDVQGFTNAILKLSADKDKRESFGNNGRRKALSELTWYRNVDRFLQLFLKIQPK
jgi:glycosyltransferase involved in cell wall biosynthesis